MNLGRFEINQLLIESVADSRRSCVDWRVSLVLSKVMRCSRNGNGGRMHVILNGETLEEVGCFKYLGSQVTADRR